jgi:hypothetical protein
LVDLIYPKIKDHLDGQPFFYMEEHEDDSMPKDGENIEEVQTRVVQRRKVGEF